MRSKFDEQMDELNNQMINMGTMIERSIAKAVEALTKKNSVLAEEVTAEDEIIDRQQKLIENMCFNLLIQQQPVAKDLRTITAAMKIVTDMESAHAVAYALKKAKEMTKDQSMIICLSGRGDKDVNTISNYLAGKGYLN